MTVISQKIQQEERYYLTDMYEAETFIVKRFRGLNSNKELVNKHYRENLIKKN